MHEEAQKYWASSHCTLITDLTELMIILAILDLDWVFYVINMYILTHVSHYYPQINTLIETLHILESKVYYKAPNKE